MQRPLSRHTADRIAACAALGLHYWTDAPLPHAVWAVADGDRRFHLVRLDRAARLATHICGRGAEAPGMYLSPGCPGSLTAAVWPDLRAEAARTLDALFVTSAELRGELHLVAL